MSSDEATSVGGSAEPGVASPAVTVLADPAEHALHALRFEIPRTHALEGLSTASDGEIRRRLALHAAHLAAREEALRRTAEAVRVDTIVSLMGLGDVQALMSTHARAKALHAATAVTLPDGARQDLVQDDTAATCAADTLRAALVVVQNDWGRHLDWLLALPHEVSRILQDLAPMAGAAAERRPIAQHAEALRNWSAHTLTLLERIARGAGRTVRRETDRLTEDAASADRMWRRWLDCHPAAAKLATAIARALDARLGYAGATEAIRAGDRPRARGLLRGAAAAFADADPVVGEHQRGSLWSTTWRALGDDITARMAELEVGEPAERAAVDEEPPPSAGAATLPPGTVRGEVESRAIAQRLTALDGPRKAYLVSHWIAKRGGRGWTSPDSVFDHGEAHGIASWRQPRDGRPIAEDLCASGLLERQVFRPDDVQFRMPDAVSRAVEAAGWVSLEPLGVGLAAGELVDRAFMELLDGAGAGPPLPKRRPLSAVAEIADGLTPAGFRDVLGTIRDTGLGMERAPGTYERMGEEKLRNVILAGLSGAYGGAGSGEAFNGRGKTDLLIEYGGRRLLVGECKVWDGAAKATEGLDQLLGNLTVRERHAAFVCFVRRSEFKATETKLGAVIRGHRLFVGSVCPLSPGPGIFEFQLSSDAGVTVEVGVVVLHLPSA